MIEATTGHKACVVYGALPPEMRRLQAQLFNDPDSEYKVCCRPFARAHLRILPVVAHANLRILPCRRSCGLAVAWIFTDEVFGHLL